MQSENAISADVGQVNAPPLLSPSSTNIDLDSEINELRRSAE
jgi:hypothetical protein